MKTNKKKVPTERPNLKEGEYGQYTLYTCMKVEQKNLLKLF
jgi:hypothetical protein